MKKIHVINDVSALNPIEVQAIIQPESIEQLCQIVRDHAGPISIGGGRFSMGGQIGTEGSLHIDMRSLNKIIEFTPKDKSIRVQAGICWRDILEKIDQHDLAIKIMQTYSNFTVGGSMSVNSHGRYIGAGPLILSVKSFTLIMANGDLITASPTDNQPIFYGAIGGYGGLGIIVEVQLELVPNVKIEQQQIKLTTAEYKKYFFGSIRNNPDAVFHNGDIYPTQYKKVRAITWVKTDKALTIPYRITKGKQSYALERYFAWTISTTFTGKWRREYLFDPFIYLFHRVAWRNYEAGSYNVAELEPRSRAKNTFILQEYFVPVEKFDDFLPLMRDILKRYHVNMLNISIRHANQDPGSLLAWARNEVFAFVLYFKQQTSVLAQMKVGIWTRQLINAVHSVGGSYYLPYQLHATPEQFHQCYPQANDFFQLKRELDPDYKFANKLWDKYYRVKHKDSDMTNSNSEFKTIYSDINWSDKFYLFLQNVYNIFPEDQFHHLIQKSVTAHSDDAAIYAEIQKNLPSIKPYLAELRYALPALLKQKKEMSRQTLELLGSTKEVNGYLEIGSTGRYLSDLRKHLHFNQPIYVMNDLAPTYSPADILERSQISKLGQYLLLNDYAAIESVIIPDNSIDLVTCFIGLHHSPLDKLDGFIKSVVRIMRPGAKFIIRDHNVNSEQMRAFVSLVHAVFNAGLGVSWETNSKELRHFTANCDLIAYIEARGLEFTGKKLLQQNDPSENTLMEFIKR